MLSFVRLRQSSEEHFEVFCSAFRLAPSYVYASEGRVPTAEELRVMFNTTAPNVIADDVFIYGLHWNEELCGCSFMVRGYPNAETAYLVLLLLSEEIQNRGVGVFALKKLSEDAVSWGCKRISAVVDSANKRALRFWQREGFQVTFTKELKGMVGNAVGIEREA